MWYLFGNWEDGPYGIYRAQARSPHDWRIAARWWFRNPCHNVFFHLFPFALRMVWSITLIGTPENPAAAYWPKTTGILLALTPAPTFAFRQRRKPKPIGRLARIWWWLSSSWEGYIGWRPLRACPLAGSEPDPSKSYLIGAFGMAFRKGGYVQ